MRYIIITPNAELAHVGLYMFRKYMKDKGAWETEYMGKTVDVDWWPIKTGTTIRVSYRDPV